MTSQFARECFGLTDHPAEKEQGVTKIELTVMSGFWQVENRIDPTRKINSENDN